MQRAIHQPLEGLGLFWSLRYSATIAMPCWYASKILQMPQIWVRDQTWYQFKSLWNPESSSRIHLWQMNTWLTWWYWHFRPSHGSESPTSGCKLGDPVKGGFGSDCMSEVFRDNRNKTCTARSSRYPKGEIPWKKRENGAKANARLLITHMSQEFLKPICLFVRKEGYFPFCHATMFFPCCKMFWIEKEQPDSQLDLGAVISSYSPTRIRGRSAPCFPQSSTPEMCFRKNTQMDI